MLLLQIMLHFELHKHLHLEKILMVDLYLVIINLIKILIFQ